MGTIKNTEGEDQFDLNSPLSSQNGKNPFRVDDSYFDAFDTELNSIIANLEELKTEAPVLASIPKYNPFEVPAGYFDELPTTIQQRIETEKPRASLKEWILQLISPNFLLPVVTVIVVAMATIHFVNEHVQKTGTDLTADLSLEEQLYPIDESILIDLLSKAGLENELSPSGEENITDYLIDNNVEETALNDFNTTDHEDQ